MHWRCVKPFVGVRNRAQRTRRYSRCKVGAQQRSRRPQTASAPLQQSQMSVDILFASSDVLCSHSSDCWVAMRAVHSETLSIGNIVSTACTTPLHGLIECLDKAVSTRSLQQGWVELHPDRERPRLH